VVEGTTGRRQLLVQRAQFARGAAALAFELARLGADRLELALGPVELALGLAAVLGRRTERAGKHQQHCGDAGGGAQARHQALPRPGAASRLCPVIASGLGRPIRSSRVGATSRRAPPLRRLAARPPRYSNGTGPTVCAVCGCPVSGSRIISRLPWSAVTSISPPTASSAARIAPRASSTASAAFTAASITPLWPTMSGLAMLQTMTS